MKPNNSFKLLASIIICELAGIIGSVFTAPEIGSWYKNLNKSVLSLPDWVFGPVWTTLFVLMGISLYLVWSKKFVVKNELKFGKNLPAGRQGKAWNPISQKFFSGSWQKANIVLIFFVQLVLNVLWSIIFFGMHSTGTAFFEILMLWFAIVYTIVNFYRVSKNAAWILLPYILWVSFAAILNYFIWISN